MVSPYFEKYSLFGSRFGSLSPMSFFNISRLLKSSIFTPGDKEAYDRLYDEIFLYHSQALPQKIGYLYAAVLYISLYEKTPVSLVLVSVGRIQKFKKLLERTIKQFETEPTIDILPLNVQKFPITLYAVQPTKIELVYTSVGIIQDT